MTQIHKHHYHSPINRGLYCLGLVVTVLSIGTVGMHLIERFRWIDSLYFTCMIATGQGPTPSIFPVTSLGKLFTCFIAFVSVGSMVASLGFLFGPFMGKLWKIGVIKFEEELRVLEHKKKNNGTE